MIYIFRCKACGTEWVTDGHATPCPRWGCKAAGAELVYAKEASDVQSGA